MKRTLSIIVCTLLLATNSVSAHPKFEDHYADMVAVFGFEEQPKVKEWMKFVSSDMIDKHEPFYSELKMRHPGFKCKHRLLFHWGYNSRPWSDALEKRILKYCTEVGAKSPSDTLLLFQQELRAEQKRRNGKINEKTECVFGFSSGGTDAMYANRMASMAYNVHILGDYTSDNKELGGLLDIRQLIGAIVTDIQTLDKESSKGIVAGITAINRSETDPQIKADKLMAYLKKEFPKFFREMRGGSVYRRLEQKGFKFRKAQK